jgi:hypothetical protein
MQFTGLLDKNGREIYQSNLLKSPMGEAIWEVVWEDGSQGRTVGFFIAKKLRSV